VVARGLGGTRKSQEHEPLWEEDRLSLSLSLRSSAAVTTTLCRKRSRPHPPLPATRATAWAHLPPLFGPPPRVPWRFFSLLGQPLRVVATSWWLLLSCSDPALRQAAAEACSSPTPSSTGGCWTGLAPDQDRKIVKQNTVRARLKKFAGSGGTVGGASSFGKLLGGLGGAFPLDSFPFFFEPPLGDEGATVASVIALVVTFAGAAGAVGAAILAQDITPKMTGWSVCPLCRAVVWRDVMSRTFGHAGSCPNAKYTVPVPIHPH